MKPLPLPEALRRASFGLPDLAVILAVLTLLGLIAHVGSGAMVSFRPPDVSPSISSIPATSPSTPAAPPCACSSRWAAPPCSP